MPVDVRAVGVSAVRVSVIVAVYNTGALIEPLIKSLLGQSLPSEQFEMIFVDDGSNDGVTPERLDRAAAEHDNVVVRHIPNSGWPGKPRNIGIDLARGDYVFFADHDDWFAPEALERLVAYADQNASDIVIGRYAGHNRGVAKVLFSKSRPDATLSNAPLMDSLTPHKLFRRAFLNEIGLRFPEGKRRLEDHVFVVEAYFRASKISVLADYHVYFHIGRADAGNAGYQRIDPPSYYGYVSETIDIILRYTEPGPLRDKCLRRPMRQEILGRMDGKLFLEQDADYQRSLFDAARALALEAIPSHVDDGLSVRQRVSAGLLRAGRFDDLLAYSRFQSGVRAAALLRVLDWREDGRLTIEFDAELTSEGEPLRYERRDDDYLSPLPRFGAVEGVPDRSRVCTRDVAKATVQLVARRRSDSKEFVLDTDSSCAVRDEAVGSRLELDGRVVLDPLTFGRDTRGFWDFYVKVSQTGWTKETRLGHVRAPGVDATPALIDGTVVSAYWTMPGSNLSLRVGLTGRSLAQELRPHARRAGGQVRVELPLLVTGRSPAAVVRLAPLGRGDAVTLPAEIERDSGKTTVRLTVPPGIGTGVYRVRYALRVRGWGRPRPTGALLLAAGRRAFVVPDPDGAAQRVPAPLRPPELRRSARRAAARARAAVSRGTRR